MYRQREDVHYAVFPRAAGFDAGPLLDTPWTPSFRAATQNAGADGHPNAAWVKALRAAGELTRDN
jgi:hypothetical protein